MASNMIFEPTEEQENAILTVKTELILGDSNAIVVVEAPAGAGKSETAKALMREIQDDDEALVLRGGEPRRIGYFVFNSDMKSEMEFRAKIPKNGNPDDIGIINTEFFTFHGFLRKQAEHNPVFKNAFYNQDGEYRVDGDKQSYTFKETKETVKRMFNDSSPSNTATGFLKNAMGAWLKNTEGLVAFSKRIASEFYPKEEEDFNPSVGVRDGELDEIERFLQENKEKLLEKAGLDIHADPTKDLLIALYVMQGVNDIMKNNNYSHDGYYKQVYLLAKKHKIDIFSDFNFLIIDEAQDVDPLVKELFENSNRVKVLFGDRSQAIYGFRGAVNFMEEVSQREDTLVCPITASFRFPNDVSVFSWKILETQKEFSGVKLVSAHTPTPISINSELQSIEEATDKFVSDITDKVTGEGFYEEFGVDIENAPSRAVQKYLSGDTAFIARNNSTLLEMLFESVSRLKNVQIQVEDAKTRELKSVELIDYINISLTKKISTEFKAIKDCTFNARTRSKIQEAVGEPYYQFREGQTLEDLLSDVRVASVLEANKNYSFLLDDKYKKYYDFLMTEMASREKINIPSSELENKDFKNIQSRKFTQKIRKEIEKAKNIKYDFLKDGNTLDELIAMPEVKEILLKDKNYHFLYNEEEKKEFDAFVSKTNAVRASSQYPTLTLSTIHGVKGEAYRTVNLGFDIMAENREGEITDDEIKLAYVAVTRAKEKINFVQSKNELTHPTHEMYLSMKSDIERELKKDFKYTFPKGIELKIYKENNLFFHEVKKDGDLIGLFGQENPMSVVQLAYSQLEDNPAFFRYKERGRKKGERMSYISFEGEDIPHHQVHNDKVNYRMGVASHRTEKEEEKAEQRLKKNEEPKKERTKKDSKSSSFKYTGGGI